jgi:hypothetical protein
MSEEHVSYDFYFHLSFFSLFIGGSRSSMTLVRW